jgi:hypothetical protein
MNRTLTIRLLFLLSVLASCGKLNSQQSAPAAISCPVTAAHGDPFIPPEPWPAQPPDDSRFWYGEAGLWTALPVSGAWPLLADWDKFWLWSEDFDVYEDETPDFTVTARRIDGPAPQFRSADTTNGYHESWHWAMLTGVNLPTPGCWQFEAAYKGHRIEFVVLVPEE